MSNTHERIFELDRLFAPYRLTVPRLRVSGITHDARRVRPGWIYAALLGARHDGHTYLPQALKQGAVAVVGQAPLSLPVPYLRVEDARVALAELADRFFGHPSGRLTVIGVTGTDGKTTTSFLIRHLLAKSGREVGMVGTIGVALGKDWIYPKGHFTTPEAPELQQRMHQMVEKGLEYAILETSSHALAQHRVDQVDYQLAVWTQLSPEHLDFHGDLEQYFQAKASLVEQAQFAVLNVGCPFARRLFRHPHLSYGTGPADFRATNITESAPGLLFHLDAPGFSGPVALPMIGRYNIENSLAALAAVYHSRISLAQAVEDLASFTGVPGRMQIIQAETLRVVIDFAHTAGALRGTLEALRPTTRKRLLVVIGSAGERDPRKRAPLGAVAVRHADFAIFTEEDYRSESLVGILAEMARGATEAGGKKGRDFTIVPERQSAIRHALALAGPGDTVVLCGKGHERSLERDNEILPWHEDEEVRQALGID